MTREEFVEGYMTRSDMLPYTLEGEVVTYTASDGYALVRHALECHCEEDGCEGWAMIPDGSQNWHKFQNGLTDMSFEEATRADMAIKRARA